jgi:glc operon protein GlcG
MTKLAAFAALCTVLLSSAGGAQQAAAPAAAGGNPLDVVPDKMPFDVPYGAAITLERATVAINAAVVEAKKHDWKMNVAVVDSGGNLVAFQRMDGAQLGSIPISEHKARAAVTFRRETKAWENAIQTNGYNYVLTLDGVIASRGGIPLVEGGRIVGGIGCSGGTGSQDEGACKAGVAALQR